MSNMRARAALVEDVGVRMPALGTRAEHERVGADRLADQSALDHVAAGLEPDAEEGVGRASEAQVEPCGACDEIATFVEVDAERLLAERGLARLECRAASPPRASSGGVRFTMVSISGSASTSSKVERARDAVFGREQRGPFRQRVGARDDLDEVELARASRVLRADDTAADDRDLRRVTDGPATARCRRGSGSCARRRRTCRCRSGRARRCASAPPGLAAITPANVDHAVADRDHRVGAGRRRGRPSRAAATRAHRARATSSAGSTPPTRAQ